MMIRHFLKRLLTRTCLYPLIYPCLEARRRKKTTPSREIAAWEARGRPFPPPHAFKRRVLENCAERYGLEIMVETGTFLGDMVADLVGRFEKVYSIELRLTLYRRAVRRFRKYPRVHILFGNSASVLAGLMREIDRPALFWLDGHYSGALTAGGNRPAPVLEELRHITGARDHGHVIVIDDARNFGSDPAYPRLEELVGFIRARRPEAVISTGDDMVMITPPPAGAERN